MPWDSDPMEGGGGWAIVGELEYGISSGLTFSKGLWRILIDIYRQTCNTGNRHTGIYLALDHKSWQVDIIKAYCSRSYTKFTLFSFHTNEKTQLPSSEQNQQKTYTLRLRVYRVLRNIPTVTYYWLSLVLNLEFDFVQVWLKAQG